MLRKKRGNTPTLYMSPREEWPYEVLRNGTDIRPLAMVEYQAVSEAKEINPRLVTDDNIGWQDDSLSCPHVARRVQPANSRITTLKAE